MWKRLIFVFVLIVVGVIVMGGGLCEVWVFLIICYVIIVLCDWLCGVWFVSIVFVSDIYMGNLVMILCCLVGIVDEVDCVKFDLVLLVGDFIVGYG